MPGLYTTIVEEALDAIEHVTEQRQLRKTHIREPYREGVYFCIGRHWMDVTPEGFVIVTVLGHAEYRERRLGETND